MKMKLRLHSWFDSKAMKELFGVQVQIDKGIWMHSAKNGKANIFKTKKAAFNEMERIKKAFPKITA